MTEQAILDMTIQDTIDMLKELYPDGKILLSKSPYHGQALYEAIVNGKVEISAFLFDKLKEKIWKKQRKGKA